MPEQPTMLDALEVGRRLGVDHSTVCRACNAGRIPGAYRDQAGFWRIPSEVLRNGDKIFRKTRPAGGADGQSLQTLPQVSAKTGLPLRWLRAEVRGKRIAHVKAGGVTLMSAAHVDAAIKHAEVGSAFDETVLAERQRRAGRGRLAS